LPPSISTGSVPKKKKPLTLPGGRDPRNPHAGAAQQQTGGGRRPSPTGAIAGKKKKKKKTERPATAGLALRGRERKGGEGRLSGGNTTGELRDGRGGGRTKIGTRPSKTKKGWVDTRGRLRFGNPGGSREGETFRELGVQCRGGGGGHQQCRNVLPTSPFGGPRGGWLCASPHQSLLSGIRAHAGRTGLEGSAFGIRHGAILHGGGRGSANSRGSGTGRVVVRVSVPMPVVRAGGREDPAAGHQLTLNIRQRARGGGRGEGPPRGPRHSGRVGVGEPGMGGRGNLGGAGRKNTARIILYVFRPPSFWLFVFCFFVVVGGRER